VENRDITHLFANLMDTEASVGQIDALPGEACRVSQCAAGRGNPRMQGVEDVDLPGPLFETAAPAGAGDLVCEKSHPAPGCAGWTTRRRVHLFVHLFGRSR
jgi:hypothetical protein